MDATADPSCKDGTTHHSLDAREPTRTQKVKGDGRPLHPERFSRWFERLAREASLPKIRLHDVRHSYATAALAAGVPAKVVSERLGHANIAITMDIYSHVLPGMDERAASVVARLILDDEPPGEAAR